MSLRGKKKGPGRRVAGASFLGIRKKNLILGDSKPRFL